MPDGIVPEWNLCAAWIGILLGIATGSVHGLFFHDEQWLGGYGSWRRRITRLGHVSLFGLAFVNLAYVFTADRLRPGASLFWPSVLFIVGAATMPMICYASAWDQRIRHLFLVPVLSLALATLLLLGRLLS
jgi:hypothetical protein